MICASISITFGRVSSWLISDAYWSIRCGTSRTSTEFVVGSASMIGNETSPPLLPIEPIPGMLP